MLVRNSDEYDYFFNFIVVGDSGVGKSCLLLRFADDEFTESYISTHGIDFKFRRLEDVEGQRIKIRVWDTAGQDRFRPMAAPSYRDKDGILLLFDMTDEESFTNIEGWLSEIERSANENVVKILVGTKSDLIEERQVTQERAQAFADGLGIPFIMTNSKTVPRDHKDSHVDEAFKILCQERLKKIEEFKANERKTVAPPAPAAPPAQTIGIGDILLWPFRKIWDGIKAIGRGFQYAGRGFLNLFRRSPDNAAAEPPQNLITKITSDNIDPNKVVHFPPGHPSHRAAEVKAPPAAPVVVQPQISQQTREQLEAKRQQEIADLKHQAEIAELKRKTADAEAAAAAATLAAQRDANSADALIKIRQQQKAAEEKRIEEENKKAVVGPDQEGENSIGPDSNGP